MKQFSQATRGYCDLTQKSYIFTFQVFPNSDYFGPDHLTDIIKVKYAEAADDNSVAGLVAPPFQVPHGVDVFLTNELIVLVEDSSWKIGTESNESFKPSASNFDLWVLSITKDTLEADPRFCLAE